MQINLVMMAPIREILRITGARALFKNIRLEDMRRIP